jgi:HK97 family phage major capsid protein
MADENVTIADATKVGARNNRMDKETIQKMHDAAVQLGADCEPMEYTEKNADPEELVFFGSTVKAVRLDDGSVKLGGYLVTFGDPNNTDLTGDFFANDTDYGDASESDVYFNHRMPIQADGKRIEYKNRLSRARLQKDDVGIFAETIIKARNEYEQAIIDAGLAGKLGWSSGTAGHLVDREPMGKAWKITAWSLGLDASLTPTPAEPRNTVVPLKSISVSQVETEQAAQDKREAEATPDTIQPIGSNTKGVKMEFTKEELQAMLTEASENGAKKAIEATEPVRTAGVRIEVVTAEEDRPFKSLAEQCSAVKDFYISMGRTVHSRIKGLNAKAIQGASESVPTDGGILLEPTITPTVLMPIHEEGVFSADVSKLPVQANSNSGWINGVDETDRANGSRWGGVRGYRLAEGATVTKSKPKFRRIQWELKKYGALVYDTNELLKDAGQFNAVAQKACREEISFMLNDDIFEGIGVSGAQGVMQSGALISVARDTTALIKGVDISAMWQRLALRSKAKSKWYVNSECAPQLDALFAVGSTTVLFPYAGYTKEGVRTLYGRPVVETEFNAALNTTGDILLADMSEYLLWEKGGVDYQTSMHVEFLTDQEVLRFIYRADGQTALASAITPFKGTLTHSPFVVLGSASA